MTTTTPLHGARTGGTLVPVDHRTVLVPLDGSLLSEHALEPARWLAAHLGATMHTVIVGFVDDTRWYTHYTRELRQQWPQMVPHFVGHLDVATGIVDLAGELPDCLVCIGTHGRSRSAALLGSTFVAVARSQAAPLIAIGPRGTVPRRDARRVVACVDGTGTSEQILPLAGGWARRLGATLDIVVVVEPPPPLRTRAERHRPSPLADPTTYVTDLAGSPVLTGLEVEAHVAFDPLGPDQGLTDHLVDHPATLVATTSRLRIHVDRALHGSTSSRIIHASPVPVLVQPAVAQPPAGPPKWSK